MIIHSPTLPLPYILKKKKKKNIYKGALWVGIKGFANKSLKNRGSVRGSGGVLSKNPKDLVGSRTRGRSCGLYAGAAKAHEL